MLKSKGREGSWGRYSISTMDSLTPHTGSHRQGDTIWISNLKKGGIASRMGMLQSGDVLLAVNGESLDQATLRDAAKMLRNAGDVVTLTVSKESGE